MDFFHSAFPFALFFFAGGGTAVCLDAWVPCDVDTRRPKRLLLHTEQLRTLGLLSSHLLTELN